MVRDKIELLRIFVEAGFNLTNIAQGCTYYEHIPDFFLGKEGGSFEKFNPLLFHAMQFSNLDMFDYLLK